jgi:hypothetical protein
MFSIKLFKPRLMKYRTTYDHINHQPLKKNSLKVATLNPNIPRNSAVTK